MEEYVELLSNKKIKKSLECEISEAIYPILERNSILYSSFLYDLDNSIQENTELNKNVLTVIRENSSSTFIIEAMTDETKAKLKKAGKVAAGVGALAGVAGTAYAKRDELGNMAKTTGKAVKKFFNRDNSTPVKTKYTNHITI